ncbi:type II toxin-antitoxin system RelE/ParE family toxin [Compostimonas suwonensis]|uniref:Toxin ParE1/3/4 n=1 Tax=Compostimonas suwonensis TaxID=1048394 RepID=A0A2M9BBQ5_9MICO|nr:type II toxin-antitoxin system RelE/ParE family toxin [Compostimonas suwonensis]PJJ55376.1 toxin ParE1/3/4 [Compostimonas suwonensis]
MTFGLDLAPEAEADIDDILEWSVTQFGAAVRDGYEALIDVAILSILDDPNRAGSLDRADLGRGIRTLHLASSRDDVSQDVRRIANPRHFVVYRQVEGVIQVARLLHEAMNLPEQHIP